MQEKKITTYKLVKKKNPKKTKTTKFSYNRFKKLVTPFKRGVYMLFKSLFGLDKRPSNLKYFSKF